MNINGIANKAELIFTVGELFTLSVILQKTVLNIIPPFRELKKYFDEIISVMKFIKLPLIWETPAKMIVTMSQRKMISTRIKTDLIKKAKPISILVPTDQIDYKMINKGLMPNFIHSLDASNIHILIKYINIYNLNLINLYTIHDCFASDAKSMSIIEFLVKKSFSEIYFDEDYLKLVQDSFFKQIEQKTEIFEEIDLNNNNEKKKFILPEKFDFKNGSIDSSENTLTNKVYLPKLPDYNWKINKEKLLKDFYNTFYFIS